MTGYVYALWDKTENDIFYIGSSINPKRRAKEHKHDNTFTGIVRQYNVTIIEEVEFENKKELLDTEIYWIHQFYEWGFNIKNKMSLYWGYRYGVQFKMTYEKAMEIRVSKKSRTELSKQYFVSPTTIHLILNNKMYKTA